MWNKVEVEDINSVLSFSLKVHDTLSFIQSCEGTRCMNNTRNLESNISHGNSEMHAEHLICLINEKTVRLSEKVYWTWNTFHFSLQLSFKNIFHSNEYLVILHSRYAQKYKRSSCKVATEISYLNKYGHGLIIFFIKLSKSRFHENPYSSSSILWIQTDGWMDEVNLIGALLGFKCASCKPHRMHTIRIIQHSQNHILWTWTIIVDQLCVFIIAGRMELQKHRIGKLYAPLTYFLFIRHSATLTT
jgi:hypothetical protein